MAHPFIKKLQDFLSENNASIWFYIDGDTHCTTNHLCVDVEGETVYDGEDVGSTDDL